jgi:CubicO group peptidase (beta-lactamase class C family)
MEGGKIIAMMREGVASRVFPGGALLIHHRDRVVFHRAFGWASFFPKPLRVTQETRFDLASLTKPLVTAAAILLLAQKKALALSDRVCRYIPTFSGDQKSKVTLQHLLNHTSGLPAWKPYSEQVCPQVCPREAGKEAIYRLAHAEPLLTSPGDQSVYSDIGFILLGEVVERVSGQPLHRFCARHILGPAGCRATGFIHNGRRPAALRGARFAATSDRASVRVHDDNAWRMGGVAGHAGLFATALDVYRLLRLWLDSLRGAGPFDPLLTTQFVTRQPKSKGATFGLGWDTPAPFRSSAGRFFSKSSFGHLGFTGTSIWADRACDLAVILLTHRVYDGPENRKIQAFRPKLHDLIFQEVVGGAE